MCGRFSLGASATTLVAQFDLFEAPSWSPRYNIAPTQEVLVVVEDPATASRQPRRHRWGLIPSWAKHPTTGNQLINAQAETAGIKPAFRPAFKMRRCLILADRFYEWKKGWQPAIASWIRGGDGGMAGAEAAGPATPASGSAELSKVTGFTYVPDFGRRWSAPLRSLR